MGRHSGSPPDHPPRPPRHQLRREYERLYAHYTELSTRYSELLSASLTAAQQPADGKAHAAWDRAVSQLEQDTTEEIPVLPEPGQPAYPGPGTIVDSVIIREQS